MRTREIVAGRGRTLVAGAVVAVIAIGTILWVAGRTRDEDRIAEVASRGAVIMPFDLERTTHRFQPRSDGGLQTVVADDPTDRGRIDLIRKHLIKEAERFRAGDFGDPASIHGEEMPGLAELKRGINAIEVRYEDVPAGARMLYQTDDPVLVQAIHDWFEAQLTDHGPHAERSP